MKRFLLTWVSLTAVLLVGTALVSYLAFGRVDLRFGAVFQVLVIPVAQTAVLMWGRGDWSLGGLLAALRSARGRPFVVTLLAVDAVVLGCGWVLYAHSAMGIAATGGLQPAWTGIKALAAALALATLATSGARGEAGRLWLGFVALVVLTLAVNAFRPWLPALADRLLPFALPTVLRWAVVYGGTYVLCMMALVRTGTVVRRRSALAGWFVDAALAVAFTAGVITVLGIFLKPYLVEPWASIARTCVSLTATFMLAAPLSALSGRGRATS